MFPEFYLAQQTFPRPLVADLQATVVAELEKLRLPSRLPKGARIAITGGSRGINNIVAITRTAIDYLKGLGFHPCLVAAMGSHGGGTGEGQREVLTSLGFTEEALGVPVLTGGETVEVGKTATGLTAFINKIVSGVDGILVINRLKYHTALVGDIQSGLVKSIVVGLGGPAGAEQFHSLGVRELPACLRDIGSILINKTPMLGGLAIIENGYDETAHIIGVEARDFLTREPELFAKAAELMPSLPTEKLDALVIEEMGKNYSGTGIDTNVIGRFRLIGEEELPKPVIRRVAVLDLSEASHGNANGMGLADVITDKLLSKVDLKKTYLNVLTTGFVQRCFIPLHFPTEKEALEGMLRSLGRTNPATLRMMIIPNTLALESTYVSQALVPELRERPNLKLDSKPVKLEFDAKGDMVHRLLRRAKGHTSA